MRLFHRNNASYLFLIMMMQICLVPGRCVYGQQREAFIEVKLLMENFRFDEAILRIDRILASDTSNIELWMLRSKALSARSQFLEANDALVRVVRSDSTNIQAWYEMFNNYRQLGNKEMAVFSCKKIMALRPENRYFPLQLANLYYNHEDYESALETMTPLWRADTQNVYVNRQIGNCYNELKMADSAILYYSRALTIYPDDAVTVSRLINLYLKKKEFPVALMLASAYLNKDSLNSGILKLAGYCYYLMKDYETAEKYFLKSVEAGDDSRFVMKYLGLCYYKTENYALAEPRFRKAFIMDTTDAEVCFYCGVSAGRSMLLDSGLIMLNKTLKLLLPSDDFLATLYAELASVYNQMDRSDTALSLLFKARDTSPANPALSFKIAYQYDYYLQAPDHALPWYQDYLNEAPEPDVTPDLAPQHIPMTEYAKNRITQISENKSRRHEKQAQ
ncbi:MAG: tetratricopeptide repeat protein [Alphaproteobacteria bacterium]|nr:tetratricopeptide repeat protein [Alphaproteobacteria bacterium]